MRLNVFNKKFWYDTSSLWQGSWLSWSKLDNTKLRCCSIGSAQDPHEQPYKSWGSLVWHPDR